VTSMPIWEGGRLEGYIEPPYNHGRQYSIPLTLAGNGRAGV
jgi:hypothetical protein